jgi:hypothetical protein
MLCSVHQPILVAEACLEQDTMEEFGSFMKIQHILI